MKNVLPNQNLNNLNNPNTWQEIIKKKYQEVQNSKDEKGALNRFFNDFPQDSANPPWSDFDKKINEIHGKIMDFFENDTVLAEMKEIENPEPPLFQKHVNPLVSSEKFKQLKKEIDHDVEEYVKKIIFGSLEETNAKNFYDKNKQLLINSFYEYLQRKLGKENPKDFGPEKFYLFNKLRDSKISKEEEEKLKDYPSGNTPEEFYENFKNYFDEKNKTISGFAKKNYGYVKYLLLKILEKIGKCEKSKKISPENLLELKNRLNLFFSQKNVKQEDIKKINDAINKNITGLGKDHIYAQTKDILNSSYYQKLLGTEYFDLSNYYLSQIIAESNKAQYDLEKLLYFIQAFDFYLQENYKSATGGDFDQQARLTTLPEIFKFGGYSKPEIQKLIKALESLNKNVATPSEENASNKKLLVSANFIERNKIPQFINSLSELLKPETNKITVDEKIKKKPKTNQIIIDENEKEEKKEKKYQEEKNFLDQLRINNKITDKMHRLFSDLLVTNIFSSDPSKKANWIDLLNIYNEICELKSLESQGASNEISEIDNIDNFANTLLSDYKKSCELCEQGKYPSKTELNNIKKIIEIVKKNNSSLTEELKKLKTNSLPLPKIISENTPPFCYHIFKKLINNKKLNDEERGFFLKQASEQLENSNIDKAIFFNQYFTTYELNELAKILPKFYKEKALSELNTKIKQVTDERKNNPDSVIDDAIIVSSRQYRLPTEEIILQLEKIAKSLLNFNGNDEELKKLLGSQNNLIKMLFSTMNLHSNLKWKEIAKGGNTKEISEALTKIDKKIEEIEQQTKIKINSINKGMNENIYKNYPIIKTLETFHDHVHEASILFNSKQEEKEKIIIFDAFDALNKAKENLTLAKNQFFDEPNKAEKKKSIPAKNQGLIKENKKVTIDPQQIFSGLFNEKTNWYQLCGMLPPKEKLVFIKKIDEIIEETGEIDAKLDQESSEWKEFGKTLRQVSGIKQLFEQSLLNQNKYAETVQAVEELKKFIKSKNNNNLVEFNTKEVQKLAFLLSMVLYQSQKDVANDLKIETCMNDDVLKRLPLLLLKVFDYDDLKIINNFLTQLYDIENAGLGLKLESLKELFCYGNMTEILKSTLSIVFPKQPAKSKEDEVAEIIYVDNKDDDEIEENKEDSYSEYKKFLDMLKLENETLEEIYKNYDNKFTDLKNCVGEKNADKLLEKIKTDIEADFESIQDTLKSMRAMTTTLPEIEKLKKENKFNETGIQDFLKQKFLENYNKPYQLFIEALLSTSVVTKENKEIKEINDNDVVTTVFNSKETSKIIDNFFSESKQNKFKTKLSEDEITKIIDIYLNRDSYDLPGDSLEICRAILEGKTSRDSITPKNSSIQNK